VAALVQQAACWGAVPLVSALLLLCPIMLTLLPCCPCCSAYSGVAGPQLASCCCTVAGVHYSDTWAASGLVVEGIQVGEAGNHVKVSQHCSHLCIAGGARLLLLLLRLLRLLPLMLWLQQLLRLMYSRLPVGALPCSPSCSACCWAAMPESFCCLDTTAGVHHSNAWLPSCLAAEGVEPTARELQSCWPLWQQQVVIQQLLLQV
jgi:hypothetical protein